MMHNPGSQHYSEAREQVIRHCSGLAGEAVGLIHEVLPAGEIVKDLVGDAQRLLASGLTASARV